jgi:signal transduction histidine kinase
MQVAMVSHDLRAPLQVIILGLEMLRRPGHGTMEDHIVQRLHEVATRMADLVDRMLEASVLELRAPIAVQRTLVNLEDLCRKTVEELRIGHPDREIRFMAASGVRGWWDRLRLVELLSNLVENALEHGDAGAPVDVHVRKRTGTAQIDVVNRGPTIPRELSAAMFEPFRRLPSTVPRSGVGLGLYIVAQIVSSHGGTVDVRSSHSRTKFTVTLPTHAP